MSARGVMRTVKNYTKGYSPIQMKVREATSNDPTIPSGALMSEIAQATYNQTDFLGVMEIIDKRLNDKGKNWRHVFKALTLLDVCLHIGSKTVVEYAIDNIFIVKTLREFQHIDDSGRDQGANVRQKAKEVTLLLLDRTRLEKERANRGWMNSRMGFGGPSMDHYNSNYASSSGRLPPGGASGSRTRPDDRAGHGRRNSFSHPNQKYGDDEGEMRKAIAESKRVAASKRVPANYDEDAELKKAIEESAREAKRDEEERKRKAQASAAANTSGEADLLGGLDDAFSTTGANSSVNNFNNSTMVSTTSFTQQQQYGSNSAGNDLVGAFGGGGQAQMGVVGNQFGGMGAGNAGFDPFGLSGDGSMNGQMNNQMNSQMGMNFSSPLGIAGNAYDSSSNNMFGGDSSNMFGGNSSSTNHVVTRTTITTTGMAVGGGTPNPFGQTNTMMSTPNTGLFDASGLGVHNNSGNLFDAGMGAQSSTNNLFGSGMGAQSNSGNLFGSGMGNGSATLLGMSGADTGANSGGFNGASGAFGSAFDGGLSAKTLPFGVNPNDPNSKLAEIARNSDKIDPFASLAMGSSGMSGGGQTNPFGGSSTVGLGGITPSQAMNASSSFLGMPASTSGNLTTIGSSLVDLSPAALSMSNNNSSFQSFGQVNRNPFATGDGSATAMSIGGNKQPSLNQLMSGGGVSQAPANVFGQQQQQTPNMMGGFGGMQTNPQSQQMAFQQQQLQQQQQQQVNPFAQTNQNNFFGL
ncbi:hypothetical protein IWW37_003169 [Coemansia sp. RSA 2050]|nr:hypothetical protein IWW37_003169 [Coemansia sp. RSA 2050]KAJ2735212.1 hypothetical protein IW152_001731 [Coemansia sp. BCRC 34962]